MTHKLIDLGHSHRKLLVIQKNKKDQIEIVGCDSLPASETDNYWDGLIADLPVLKRRWKLGQGPIECLLPAVFFNHESRTVKKDGGIWETIEVAIHGSIGHKINRILERHGLEASFLGSSLTSTIEVLRRHSLANPKKTLILIVLAFSSTQGVLIQQGHIKKLEASYDCSSRILDTLICSRWPQAAPDLTGIKQNELILLPIYRQEQELVEGFQKLRPYFEGILDFLRNSFDHKILSEKKPQPEILLSDGGSLVRNLNCYIQGTLNIPCHRVESAFFNQALENPKGLADLTSIFNPLLAHAMLRD